MSNLELARQRLQQQDADGYSAYDHISEILLKLVSEQPEGSLELFEHLSSVIKAARPAAVASGAAAAADAEAARQAAAQWSANCTRLITGDKDPESGEFVPPPEGAEDKLVDIVHAAEALEDAGVSFGDEETIRIKQSMVHTLGANDGIEKLRLFGKVLGLRGDYFVFEATQDSVLSEEEAADSSYEPAANKYAYYAANEVGQAFVRLPNVSAAHVLGSLRIRKFLTGSLTAPVRSHPPLPGGTEAHLLRALIARISADTAVAPSYFHAPGEPAGDGAVVQDVVDGEQMEDDEFVAPTGALLASSGLAAFRTFKPPHLANGYLGTPQIPDPADPDARIPDPSAPKPLPAVRPLAADEWTTELGASSGQCVLRSQVWPGLTTLAAGKTSVTVYVGFGIRAQAAGSLQWSPQFPAPIADEVDDAAVQEQEDNMDKPVLPEATAAEGGGADGGDAADDE